MIYICNNMIVKKARLMQNIACGQEFEGLKGLVVAGTGHRPEKLGGYGASAAGRRQGLATAVLRRYQPSTVIAGMALGWDWALAEATLALGLPLIAAVPFEGQERLWPAPVQKRYREMLRAAAQVQIVSPGGYSARAMQVRNEWMVDRAQLLLTLWNGSAGGTRNCIEYANQVGKPWINTWASWEKYRGDRL
jgi:hypothetical protein